MKSNEQFTEDIVKKVKAKRKKKRFIVSGIVLSVCALLCFVVGYSNIITFEIGRYQDSYLRYLVPYLSAEEEIGLRFVDAQNAVVNIESKTYPCALKANSENDFTLTVVESETDTLTREETQTQSPSEEEPSVFHVEFWDANAKISWNILGVKIEKILSVTEERDIPAGLWSLFATQDGPNGKLNNVSGAGWTLILENGDSYTGEGMDSAWRSKFVSVGNTLLQCSFDAISGLIKDASVFTYDETSFDYPVIKERYLSDGDEYYFYSRLLPEEERIDFKGGTFTASAVMRETENHSVTTAQLLDESMAKWQLLPQRSQEMSPVSVQATLTLSANGSVSMKITGDNDYDGKFQGKWYPLKHSVLVVLDKKSALTGRLFTLYADSGFEVPSGELVQKYAQSRIESVDCYKIGYHTFDYYIAFSETLLYWGNEWTPDKLSPELKYETEYVLYGQYYYEYYDGDYNKFDPYSFTEDLLVEMSVSGKLSFVFHEDGTVTITRESGETETRTFEVSDSGGRIDFSWQVELWQGANATTRPNKINSNFIIDLSWLSVDFNALWNIYDTYYSYVDFDENGNRIQKDGYVLFYKIYLRPKFD